MSIENFSFSQKFAPVEEDEDLVVTYKIWEDDRNWADRQQKAIKKPGGRKLTQWDFFSQLRALWENHHPESVTTARESVRGKTGDSSSGPVAIDVEFHRPLTSRERDTVRKLLKLIDRGSPTVKDAIMRNLDGFLEPILEAERGHFSQRPARTIPEAVDYIRRSIEAVGSDEADRAGLLEAIREITEGSGRVPPEHSDVRTAPRGGRKAGPKRPRSGS